MTQTGEVPGGAHTPPGPGEGRYGRIAFAAAVVLVGVVLDQVTKYIAIVTLAPMPGNPPIVFFGDFFRFQFATNTGAFLSLGSTLPEGARFWVLTGVNAVILAGVAVFLVLRRQIGFWATLALSLILAGGIGNLIDRLFRDGVVIDFMNLGVPGARIPFVNLPLRTGIFNIADVAIMVGLGVLVATEIFARPKGTDDAANKP